MLPVDVAASEASQFAPLRLEKDDTKNGPPELQENSAAKVAVGEEGVEKERKGNDNPPPKQDQDKPLNIVVLYADDWRHDDLGVASNGVVHTPFLDWLSKNKGIRFTRNCVTTSVCWISRATLHTGQYYSRHKATRPKDNEWYQGWGDAFPEILKKMGYYVGHIGKWHSMDFNLIKATYNFERMYFGKHWFPGKVTVYWVYCLYNILENCFLILSEYFPCLQHQKHATENLQQSTNKHINNISGTPRPIHVTERNERDALEMLQKRPKDKPFALTVAFFAPHSVRVKPLFSIRDYFGGCFF